MSSKKKRFTDNKSKQWDFSQFLLENKILNIIDEAGLFATEKHLQTVFAAHVSKKPLQKALSALIAQGFLKHTDKRYSLAPKAPLLRGVLTQNPRGFGFLTLEKVNGRKQEQKDPFIPKEEMRGAIHGDRVLVRQMPQNKNARGRSRYTIIRVEDCGPDTLCGILREKGGNFTVVPDNPQVPFKIEVEASKLKGANPGDAVQVHFQRQDSYKRSCPGEIIAVLGSPALIDTQMQLTIERFDLPTEFSKAAMTYAKKLTMPEPAPPSRRDLRQTMHITIDGAEAKDFDDAICIELLSNEKLRLYVSIADVSHFVKSGTALDNEAYQRGTSVYFPGRVIPMLPEELSNGLCSLTPGDDRYTVTAQLDFDKTGKIVHTDFYNSTIRSKQRFTYDEIAQLLTDNNALSEKQQKFLPMLQQAEQLADSLRQKRFSRGAINFNLREAVFTLDDEGRIASITAMERNLAHKMIEEFMLIANESVARFLTKKIAQPLFRVHEQPDAIKVKDFQFVAKTLGIELPRHHKGSSWFAEVIRRAEKTKHEYIINNLLLRSLPQAYYSTKQNGHFGLASMDYTHFTSPIRRYPDLIVHRMLTAILKAKEKKTRKQKFAPQSTGEAATFLSSRERIAIDAERDMNDRLKVAHMKDKIGDIFQAIISGVTENVLFVELEEPMVSGAVPVELLGNEYFFYDPERQKLLGEISKKEYQLGGNILVKLVDINMSRRQLTFQLETSV